MADLRGAQDWVTRTRWPEMTMDAGAVAQVLGTTSAMVRQYLSNDPTFPAPSRRGANGRNLWPAEVIYQRALDISTPRRRLHVPRLFTAQPLNEARFVDSLCVTLPTPRRGTIGAVQVFGVHVWNPSDTRGQVAIAYQVPWAPGWREYPHGPHWEPPDMAAALFRELRSIVSAVAFADHAPMVVAGITQPSLWVADASSPEVAQQYGWLEMANLLRTDLPWWSATLRYRDPIIDWTPGTPQRRLRPSTSDADPACLLGVLSLADTPPAVRDVTARLAHLSARRLVESVPTTTDVGEDFPTQPGLRQAAVADVDLTDDAHPVSRDELALLLHHRIDTPLPWLWATALPVAPLVTTVARIDPELMDEPMVAEWMADLLPAEDAAGTELGFAVLRELADTAGSRSAVMVGNLVHRRDPDLWAARCLDGSVHFTVGAGAPAARGALREVLVSRQAAFFRDGDGAVWPLPSAAGGPYTAGLDAPSSRPVAAALTRLRVDAAADLDNSVAAIDPDVWQLVVGRGPTFTATIGAAAPARTGRRAR